MVRQTLAQRLWFIATLLLLAFTAACGGSEAEGGSDSPPELTLESDQEQEQGLQEVGSGPDSDTATPLSMSAGNRQACVITPERDVQCWGSNNFGQVGTGSSQGTDEVVTVGGLPPMAQVSAGGSHNCALSIMAEVWCWGNNDLGQLGSEVTPWTSTPQRVEGLPTIVSVSAGGESVCALASEGSVWCWGTNVGGELASTEIYSTNIPQRIDSLPGIAAISGGGRFYCAIDDAGEVWCWGNNASGQIGWAPSDDVRTPVKVPSVSDAVQVSAGGSHSCAVLASQAVWCWGGNEYGELGTGVVSEYMAPSEAIEFSPAQSVTVSRDQSCVLLADGAGVGCLGRNFTGVQGDGAFFVQSTTQVAVPDSAGAIAVDLHGAAVTVFENGTVRSWGGFFASPVVRQVDGATAATGRQPVASVLQYSAVSAEADPTAVGETGAEAAEVVDYDPQEIALGLAEQYIQAVRDGDDAAIDALVSDDAVGDPVLDQPFDDPELACSEGADVVFQWCTYLADFGIIELTINVEQVEITGITIIYFGD